jgi:hypothetical protein
MKINFDSTYPKAYQVMAVEAPSGAETMRHLYFPGAVEAGKDGVILKVSPRNAEPWVGTFAFGYQSPPALTAVLGCPDERMLCVISAGQGYTVLTDDPYRWNRLAPFPIVQAFPIPTKRIIVLADFTTLTGYRNEVPLWQTEQLSWDGINITEVAQGSLKGTGWDAPDQREVAFIVDLETGFHEFSDS